MVLRTFAAATDVYTGMKKQIGHFFGYLSMLGATVVTLLDYFYNDVIIWVWLLYGIVIVPLVAASAIIAIRAFFPSLPKFSPTDPGLITVFPHR